MQMGMGNGLKPDSGIQSHCVSISSEHYPQKPQDASLLYCVVFWFLIILIIHELFCLLEKPFACLTNAKIAPSSLA